MAKTKPNPLMPSKVFAKKILELRNRQGWTQDDLASRVTKLGMAWSRTTVAKVEKGTRQVTVDELICLAHALNAHPAALLVSDDSEQFVTPTTKVKSRQFWQWLTGHQPIRIVKIPTGKQPETYFAAPDQIHYEPEFVSIAEARLPGIRNVLDWASQVQTIAAGDAAADDLKILDTIAGQLKTLAAEVELLRQRADIYRGNDDWDIHIQFRETAP